MNEIMRLGTITKTGLGLILVVTILVAPLIPISYVEATPGDNAIMLQYLYNAGVRIEAKGVRIYIDPYTLTANFSDLDADAILITHPHADHYNEAWVNALQKNDTVNVFPANMSDEIATHDGVGVNPSDSIQIGPINITAFYMYTIAPEGYDPSHPPEANWTSYIIDIDGFRIFHAGDSKNISEYDQLSGTIDVALLPLGPGCQSMTDYEVVDAIQRIDPDYFIPIHFSEGADAAFIAAYGDDIDDTTDCQIISLDNLQYYIWNLGPTTTSSTATTSSTISPTSNVTTLTTATTTSPSEPVDYSGVLIGGTVGVIALVVIIGLVIVKQRSS